MAFDYSRGEKDKPLTKKNVKWYCNKLLEYAHDGMPLEFFLRDYYLLMSSWSKYVKKHKKLQVAMVDARERYKGWLYKELFSKSQLPSNAAITKLLASHFGDITDVPDDKDKNMPAPTIIFKEGPKNETPKDHQLPGELTKSNGGNA